MVNPRLIIDRAVRTHAINERSAAITVRLDARTVLVSTSVLLDFCSSVDIPPSLLQIKFSCGLSEWTSAGTMDTPVGSWASLFAGIPPFSSPCRLSIPGSHSAARMYVQDDRRPQQYSTVAARSPSSPRAGTSNVISGEFRGRDMGPRSNIALPPPLSLYKREDEQRTRHDHAVSIFARAPV